MGLPDAEIERVRAINEELEWNDWESRLRRNHPLLYALMLTVVVLAALSLRGLAARQDELTWNEYVTVIVPVGVIAYPVLLGYVLVINRRERKRRTRRDVARAEDPRIVEPR